MNQIKVQNMQNGADRKMIPQDFSIDVEELRAL